MLITDSAYVRILKVNNSIWVNIKQSREAVTQRSLLSWSLFKAMTSLNVRLHLYVASSFEYTIRETGSLLKGSTRANKNHGDVILYDPSFSEMILLNIWRFMCKMILI